MQLDLHSGGFESVPLGDSFRQRGLRLGLGQLAHSPEHKHGVGQALGLEVEAQALAPTEQLSLWHPAVNSRQWRETEEFAVVPEKGAFSSS